MAKNIKRFVIWICSHFVRSEIEQIVKLLTDALNNKDPDFKIKNNFKEQHPNYRNFYVDPLAPLPYNPEDENKLQLNYKELLIEYKNKHGKSLSPVKQRSDSPLVPKEIICPFCNAPHKYIYYNNGKRKSQLKCKVCGNTFRIDGKYRESKTEYYCPYCHYALFKWKQRDKVTIYKCCNDDCPHRIRALSRLNAAERFLAIIKSSQFKLCYQYRVYHFTLTELKHSAPCKPKVDLNRIYNPQSILGLILTFYISFAISARKTALLLRWVFQINISYQTVLNYAEVAAYYCHSFNLKNKGAADPIQAGDETYIKIKGKHNYVWFFIGSQNRAITSYHVSDNRGEQPAITAMLEAKRTIPSDQQTTFITDGNPSYPAGIHYLNSLSEKVPDIEHHKVIGLQNLDEESEEYRPYKQIIERLNRTYKYHIKPSNGFNVFNGAMAVTALFVTFYNFLRPHMTLNYKVPVHLNELDDIPTIQARWAKILSLA